MKIFEEEGPGSVGQNMDHGIKLMEEYAEKFDDMECKRTELGNFEKKKRFKSNWSIA